MRRKIARVAFDLARTRGGPPVAKRDTAAAEMDLAGHTNRHRLPRRPTRPGHGRWSMLVVWTTFLLLGGVIGALLPAVRDP